MPATTSPLPPVYWHLLGGGPDALRLPARTQVALLAVGGIGLAGIQALATPGLRFLPHGAATFVAASLAASVAAWALAVTASRWFGPRAGWSAGVIALLFAASGMLIAAPLDMHLVTLLATACLGSYAWGNVPGRLPVDQAPWLRRGFYLATTLAALVAGFGALVCVVLTVGLYLFLLQDRRGARFVADPVGWALAAGVAAIALAGANLRGWYTDVQLEVSLWDAACGGARPGPVDLSGPGQLLGGLLVPSRLLFPLWAYLVIAPGVILWGLLQGHASAPIWRLMLCWLLGASAAWGLGMFSLERFAAVTSPVVALLTALALVALDRQLRRRR